MFAFLFNISSALRIVPNTLNNDNTRTKKLKCTYVMKEKFHLRIQITSRNAQYLHIAVQVMAAIHTGKSIQ
jgi:hypothetical protein